MLACSPRSINGFLFVDLYELTMARVYHREKQLNPGPKSAWRLCDREGRFLADWIAREDEDPRHLGEVPFVRYSPKGREPSGPIPAGESTSAEVLLESVWRKGRLHEETSLEELRRRRQSDMTRAPQGVLRIHNPQRYPVGLSRNLADLRERLSAGPD